MTPFVQAEVGTRVPANENLPTALAESRVLVVDDQASNIQLLEEILSAAGFCVLQSTTQPAHVLAICADFRPDLIVLDLHMPGLDGVAVLQGLQTKLAQDDYLPVLMLTSDMSMDAKERAFAAGASDFLTKPFHPAEVILRVKRLLAARSQFSMIRRQCEDLKLQISSRTALNHDVVHPNEESIDAIPGESGFGALFGLFAGRLTGKRVVRVEDYRRELETAVADRTSELLQAKEAAETANLLKSEFLANISREIRTPMSDVLGTLELVLSTKLSQEQKEYIELSRASAQSLTSLLDDIVDFSTIETDELEINHVEFSVRHCLRGVVSTVASRARKHPLAIHFEVPENVPDRLRGDLDRLRQVLLKLIEHTVATLKATRIVLSVSLEEPGASIQSGSVALLFQIQDSGLKLSKSAQQAIVEPMQSSRPSGRKYGGAALGMIVCGRFVRLMGGRIWFDAEASTGNKLCFTAKFDLAKIAKPMPQPATARKRESVTGAKILVVEDNRVNQTVAVRLLEKRGMHTLVANNGKEGLNLLKSEAVDLILMDVQMPEMDGLEATRRIREDEKNTGEHIPIVALTAHAMKSDREKCLAAGMDRYLSKPIQGIQLYAAIQELLVEHDEPANTKP